LIDLLITIIEAEPYGRASLTPSHLSEAQLKGRPSLDAITSIAHATWARWEFAAMIV
jgi:hypothetical protein